VQAFSAVPLRGPVAPPLDDERAGRPAARWRALPNVDAEMVRLPGGTFLMGSGEVDDCGTEAGGPVREVRLRAFWIDRCAVSNARFARFVAATHYVTEAERYGWSFVFAGLLGSDGAATDSVPYAPWWRQVFGADWSHPEGPQSDLAGRADHPAVHVSWNDARAYCAWAGVRLPTEAEWEYAARGGLVQQRFPWGDELRPGGVHRMNMWQGEFPRLNSCDDGYYGTAPVAAFLPNEYGLYNMTGNVWEWCADWFSPVFSVGEVLRNPKGPPRGTRRVVRGGSYLCHPSYAFYSHVAARSSTTPITSTGHLGFRCVRDALRRLRSRRAGHRALITWP
jgi:formylglycine-generating enzyme required for sulfatase activity